MNTNEIVAKIGEIEMALNKRMEQINTETAEAGKVSKEMVNQVNDLGKQHTELRAEIDGFRASLDDVLQRGAGALQAEPVSKSFGQAFVETDAFKNATSGTPNVSISHHFQNNTIIGEAGSPQDASDVIVAPDYRSGIIPGAFRNLRVTDAILTGTTASNQIHFTRELLFTNNAAETSEGAAKPESVLTFEAVEASVRTIPHFIKASKQVLDDAPFLASYIDARMTYGVRLRIEQQIIAGDGTAPNISGITTTGNHTDLTVVTADNDLDAMNRAKEQVISADYEPTAFMVNPADWGRIERKKTGVTNDDSYVAGNGAALSYIQNGMMPLVWGLPVILSNSVTAGTFICLAQQSLQYFEREGVTVAMFEQDEDNVQKNLLTIRAEARGALAIYRPASIIVGAFPEAA